MTNSLLASIQALKTYGNESPTSPPCPGNTKDHIDVVGTNGGHLSSNLGVVELTIALHRVFSPQDALYGMLDISVIPTSSLPGGTIIFNHTET